MADSTKMFGTNTGQLILKEILTAHPKMVVDDVTPAHIKEARKSLRDKGVIFMGDDFRIEKAHGGPVKKYAKGGSVRKVRYN
jgi:hypothetical protein